MRQVLPVLLALIVHAHRAGAAETIAAPDTITVTDTFGRPINEHGLVLVDWEGHIANPVARFSFRPPARAALPVRAVLTASEPRLYFDLPSAAGPKGPRKEFLFKDHSPAEAAIAIFPDRDAEDEKHQLTLELTDAHDSRFALSVPIQVIDQDPRDWRPRFSITVDFSQDRTGFFKDEAKRAVLVQAANDWAYFFDPAGLEPTPAAAERTFIWDADGFKSGRYITNEQAYTGFWLYAYGIKGTELRSGGEPSRMGGFQSAGGKALPIRRSGGVEVEVQGNYSTHGWLVPLDDADWWKATNLGHEPCDLYSIVHHEMGHSLIFNPGHVRFGIAKLAGRLKDSRISTYVGKDPAIDRSDHLDGTIDRDSLRGAFGFEYKGKVPWGRWLITKVDLLAAQSVGYTLRETSALRPLTITADDLPTGSVNIPYSSTLHASGGSPSYCWDVVDGSLPEGLELDTFSAEIRGKPKRAGESHFTVRVRASNERNEGARRRFAMTIRPE
jgi:hypothetical protein